MSFRINSRPTAASSSHRNSEARQGGVKKALEKMSSGHRINRAADDAAGLAVSQKLGQALKGLEQGMENAYDGMSLVQVADGGLEQVGDVLGRMRVLAMTSANGTLADGQRAAVQTEFEALRQEVDRLGGSTEFNGQALLDGSAGTVEIALGSEHGTIDIDLGPAVDSAALGLAATRLDSGDAARAALADVDAAMAQVAATRADLGGSANRLMNASRNLGVSMENTAAAQSRIIDTDYAKESAELARQQILAQGSTAVQMQSHGLSAAALTLLK